ncbi:MAG: diacylglycerol kinase family lipid kinase [Deltaproteobacteria bacterium]|nr:diacylglycerol kinase family lipid kinase [Deltaproteobacteria bacterium]
MDTVFIVNPSAGCGKAAKAFDELRPSLRSYFPRAETWMSQRQGHVRELARKAAENGVAQVVAVGGDGTINEIVNGLFANKKAVNPKLVLGILPLGTGSDFARSLGVSRKPLDALKILASGKRQAIDVGYASLVDNNARKQDYYFINVLSLGIGAEVAYASNQSSKWAGPFLSYPINTVKCIFSFRLKVATVKSSDNDSLYSGTISELAIANGKYYGGGMLIAPQAQLNDGKLQVVLIKGMSKPQLLFNLSSLFSGAHIRKHFTLVSECTWLEAESNESMLVEADGESPGGLPLRVECLKEALQVIVGDSPSLQV